jgi:hypothetical protein
MWTFKKAPPPKPSPPDKRVWNEDWQIGDIAECVPCNWYERVPPWMRPKAGSRFVVRGFSEQLGSDGALRYFLHFDELPHGLSTGAFRKVRPIANGQSEIVERILSAPAGKDNVRETT